MCFEFVVLDVSGEYVVAVVSNHKRPMSSFVLLLWELHALFCVGSSP